MLHITTDMTRNILRLYKTYGIRNIQLILATLSLWHPDLLTYPHLIDAESFEEEHLEDCLSTNEYASLKVAAGLPRKFRDRVPSDKEKVIRVLTEGKCKEWVDVKLTGAEMSQLEKLGVKAWCEFMRKDSVTEMVDAMEVIDLEHQEADGRQ
jgi:hypothetical protein